MKRSFSICLGLGALLGLAIFEPANLFAKDKPGAKAEKAEAVKNPPLKFNLDPSSISRQTGGNSYAPIIKKAAPSVVSVFSNRTVQEPDFRNNPLFNDPMFRRFFQQPPEQDEGSDEDEDSPRLQPRRRGGAGSNRPRSHQEMGLGSGVIMTQDGYIITNNHVVDDADDVKVEMANGTRYSARVVGMDAATDTAVIKIEAENLPAITIGTSEGLEVGDVVLAIGNPFGIGQTVTMGIISAVGRTDLGILGRQGYEDFIQTDAAINMGNSGGALIDAQGRLIGINAAILSRTGGNVGVGFAVPINMARYVMERLTESGRVARGMLGVNPQRVTPELAKEFKLPDTTGALVGGFGPTISPAREAGVKAGDVIVEFNGKKVLDDHHLRLMVSQTPPKTDTSIKVLREGKEKTFKVALAELPSQSLAANGEEIDPADAVPDNEALEGVEVDNLDPKVRRQFNISPQIEGALVSDVDPESKSYEAGLRPGDVILEIDHKAVKGSEDAVTLSSKVKGAHVLLRIYSRGNYRYLTVENGRNEPPAKPSRPERQRRNSNPSR